jgi:hypothetical protein
MDWFFNEYVYGTQLPSYKLDYSFEPGVDGDLVLNMKLAQSGVSPDFRMAVPIYLELASGKIARLGFARAVGNTTVEQKVAPKGVKEKPRRAMINRYHDVPRHPTEWLGPGAIVLCEDPLPGLDAPFIMREWQVCRDLLGCAIGNCCSACC